MSDVVTLKAEVREIRGKGVRHLRREGVTPIVVYGSKTEPVALQTDSKDLMRVLAKAGGTQLVAIEIAGEKKPRMTLAKAVQRHVTRLTPLHADFIEVVMDEAILKRVPVNPVGESQVVKRHQGMLNLVMDQIQVRALPADLPAAIDVDVPGLDVHDQVTLGQLTPPAGVEWVDEPDAVVVRIDASRMAAEIEEEEAVEALGEAPEEEPEAEEE
jgi:large subunit ribosomal protein L25